MADVYGFTWRYNFKTWRLYLGYSYSFIGGIIGFIWGFIDGFVCGFLIAWIYNMVSKAIKPKAASVEISTALRFFEMTMVIPSFLLERGI